MWLALFLEKNTILKNSNQGLELQSMLSGKKNEFNTWSSRANYRQAKTWSYGNCEA